MDLRLAGTRLATTTALLAAATWAAPAEAQVSLRSEGAAGGVWAPVAPALLAQARGSGATVARPAFLPEEGSYWSARPSPVAFEGLDTPAFLAPTFDPLDLTTRLRWTASPVPTPATLMRQLPLSFRVDDVLDGFDGKRALDQVFPGLKSASRVFRLGSSIRF